MKRFLLTTLALVAVAALAITGTIAYLTWEDSDVNVMTVGNVEIDQFEMERDENGKLIPFTPDKAAYPAVYQNGTTAWEDGYQSWEEAGAPGSNQLFDDSMKNVIDKFVFVKNTGTRDAYYRTYIAIECPDGLRDKAIHVSFNTNERFTTTDLGFVEHEGVQYYVYEMLYNEILTPGEVSRPSLLQVYLDPTVTNEDCAKFGETWEIIALSQAVQAAGFENANQALTRAAINDADVALDTAFGEPLTDCSDEKYERNINAWLDGAETRYEAEQEDTWDGTVDTTWYNETDSEFVITTAEQLAGLAELVDGGNTFEGKTVKLARDLDLYLMGDNGELVSFDPIGYGYDIVFRGTFDGQDHTIANLYQNGWALGLSYGTQGGGLFASVVDATIKNVNIDHAEVVMECVDMGVLVGYSYGNCTYENITVSNSLIANYQRYTGGVVGEVNGTQTFTNVDVIDTVVSSLWGDFDCSLGGIVGGKWGDADLTFEGCDVACELNAYNDVTSSYQWYAYRRAGMLIGNSEETTKVGDRTSATASYLTCKDCTVTYGDWVNYTYCEFAGTSWPYVRVQAGYSCDAYSNPRYGVATDANGNKAVDDTHVHHEGEDHDILLAFDQLFGGGQGVYGTAAHEGVTVNYNK